MSQPQTAFNKKTTAEEVSTGIDLSGKNAIVTGANTGIGEETARVLVLRGAKVIMACRHLKKAEAGLFLAPDSAKATTGRQVGRRVRENYKERKNLKEK